MGAEIALLRNMIIRIDIKRIVRACLHARLTGDTPLRIEIDDTVIEVVEGTGRADIHAGRGLTVIAPQYRKEPFGYRVFTCFHIFHPSSVHTDWNLVLRFACHRASMAADAFAVIYEKAEVHCSSSFRDATIDVDSFLSFNSCLSVNSGKPAGILKRGAGLNTRPFTTAICHG